MITVYSEHSGAITSVNETLKRIEKLMERGIGILIRCLFRREVTVASPYRETGCCELDSFVRLSG
jgi:hypothetical protein